MMTMETWDHRNAQNRMVWRPSIPRVDNQAEETIYICENIYEEKHKGIHPFIKYFYKKNWYQNITAHYKQKKEQKQKFTIVLHFQL